MRDIDFIERVKESGLGVFTVQDAARLIKSSRSYVHTYLSRLESRGRIARVERGKYALAGTPVQVVATNLLYPSYISFLSAFYFRGRTTQIPTEIDVVCTRQKKAIKWGGYAVRFVTLRPDRVFGYEKIKDEFFWFLGSVEKSIVDSLYLPIHCGVLDVAEAIGGIDEEVVIEYALRMRSIVTLKRLGFLLEREGIDIYGKVNECLNDKYDLLDPYEGEEGKRNKRWKLVINEVLE